ncbi:protein Mpv17 [Microdochium nivale]|nr:protein Mpv17 [Microdochium nivale]
MIRTTPLHAALRRHLLVLRQRRLPSAPRRAQSTSPPSSHPHAAKPHDPIPTPAAPVPPPPTSSPTSFWQRLGPVTRAGEAYAKAQRRRPYVMQTAATLVIYLAGDLCAQYIGRDTTTTTDIANDTNNSGAKTTDTTLQQQQQQQQQPSFASQYDPYRTLRSMTIGGLAAIPGWHWFLFLSNSFNFPQSRALSILVKVAVNQAFFTPVFNSYFFGAHSLLAGSTPQEALERIKRAVPVSMVNSLKLWPAVTAFSFAFVPIEFRSLFAGGVAIGWQTYLSFLNKEAAEAAGRAEAEATATTTAAPIKASRAIKSPVPSARAEEAGLVAAVAC